MVALTIFILIICALLALVVLAQNPKGGGLAAGFTGASQIGGVQRTADFLEKGTWTLSSLLMVLCLISAAVQKGASNDLNSLDTTTDQTTDGGSAPASDEVPPADNGTAPTE